MQTKMREEFAKDFLEKEESLSFILRQDVLI